MSGSSNVGPTLESDWLKHWIVDATRWNRKEVTFGSSETLVRWQPRLAMTKSLKGKRDGQSINSWAASNILWLNQGKSREMIIQRRREVTSPVALIGLSRFSSKKILGVTLQSYLSVSQHVEDVARA